MSNLSKGTGSRKDTKMRIRAFPVSAREGREATARGPAGRPTTAGEPPASAWPGLAWPTARLARPGLACHGRSLRRRLALRRWAAMEEGRLSPLAKRRGLRLAPGRAAGRLGGPPAGRPRQEGSGETRLLPALDNGRAAAASLFCFVEGLQLPWKTL